MDASARSLPGGHAGEPRETRRRFARGGRLASAMRFAIRLSHASKRSRTWLTDGISASSKTWTRLIDCTNTGAFLLPYLVAKAICLPPRVLDLHRYREKEIRAVVARLTVRCLVTSQSYPHEWMGPLSRLRKHSSAHSANQRG